MAEHLERLPATGHWTRVKDPPGLHATSASAWRYGRVMVISALEIAEAPDGRGDRIPQWHVSVSASGRRPSDRELRRALKAFGMIRAEEDNHHPGLARHFWLTLDPSRRVDCQCKVDEVTIRDADGYTWTNPAPGEGECRGCEMQRLLGNPCPLHAEPPAP